MRQWESVARYPASPVSTKSAARSKIVYGCRPIPAEDLPDAYQESVTLHPINVAKPKPQPIAHNSRGGGRTSFEKTPASSVAKANASDMHTLKNTATNVTLLRSGLMNSALSLSVILQSSSGWPTSAPAPLPPLGHHNSSAGQPLLARL
jgi:hypothetical protein